PSRAVREAEVAPLPPRPRPPVVDSRASHGRRAHLLTGRPAAGAGPDPALARRHRAPRRHAPGRGPHDGGGGQAGHRRRGPGPAPRRQAGGRAARRPVHPPAVDRHRGPGRPGPFGAGAAGGRRQRDPAPAARTRLGRSARPPARRARPPRGTAARRVRGGRARQPARRALPGPGPEPQPQRHPDRDGGGAEGGRRAGAGVPARRRRRRRPRPRGAPGRTPALRRGVRPPGAGRGGAHRALRGRSRSVSHPAPPLPESARGLLRIPTLQIADIELPEGMERLRDLAYDLWWSWSPLATRLFTWIDPEHWQRYHNPVQLLINVEPYQWQRLLGDPEFRHTYDSVIQALDEYHARPRWFDAQGAPLAGPVAYFSMEFGLHESLGVYSGGLGVLAGDHCKAASDLGVPLVGVGLLYTKGYADQRLRLDGWKEDADERFEVAATPLEPVRGPAGDPCLATVRMSGRPVSVGA